MPCHAMPKTPCLFLLLDVVIHTILQPLRPSPHPLPLKSHPASLSHTLPLRILINLLPLRPYLLLLIRNIPPVHSLALPPLGLEALDQVLLRVVAITKRFPHEAACVAFFEGVHYFFAGHVVFGVEEGMHFEGGALCAQCRLLVSGRGVGEA